MLKVLLGKDGKAESIQVLKGEQIFRKSAEDAVRKFLFEPARQSDRPVKVWLVIPIHFKLRGLKVELQWILNYNGLRQNRSPFSV